MWFTIRVEGIELLMHNIGQILYYKHISKTHNTSESATNSFVLLELRKIVNGSFVQESKKERLVTQY